MAHEALQAIVGTAIVDPRFRRNLLSKSQDTLQGFGLTSEETEAIASIDAKTMEGFAEELHGWITKNIQPDVSPAVY